MSFENFINRETYKYISSYLSYTTPYHDGKGFTYGYPNCQGIGLANKYNLISFGDVVESSVDIEGRAAIGGNATFSNFGIGAKIEPLPPYGKENILIVGGNLTWNSGTNFSGNTVMTPSGIYNVNNVSYSNADKSIQPIRSNNLPINFKEINQYFTCSSRIWANSPSEGNTLILNCYGHIYLIGDSYKLNVFHIDANKIASNKNIVGNGSNSLEHINGITIITPEDSTNMINVSGESIKLGNYSINTSTNVPKSFPKACSSGCNSLSQGSEPTANQKKLILWNFYNATTIIMSNMSFKGSILAPKATLRTVGGNIEGNVIISSLVPNKNTWNHTELHDFPFEGCLPPTDCDKSSSTTSSSSSSSSSTTSSSSSSSSSSTTSSSSSSSSSSSTTSSSSSSSSSSSTTSSSSSSSSSSSTTSSSSSSSSSSTTTCSSSSSSSSTTTCSSSSSSTTTTAQSSYISGSITINCNKVCECCCNTYGENQSNIGLQGIVVELYNCNDNQLVATLMTDENGEYLFTNVVSGYYYMKIKNVPTGYTFDFDDFINSCGETNCFYLAHGQYLVHQNISIIPFIGTCEVLTLENEIYTLNPNVCICEIDHTVVKVNIRDKKILGRTIIGNCDCCWYEVKVTGNIDIRTKYYGYQFNCDDFIEDYINSCIKFTAIVFIPAGVEFDIKGNIIYKKQEVVCNNGIITQIKLLLTGIKKKNLDL